MYESKLIRLENVDTICKTHIFLKNYLCSTKQSGNINQEKRKQRNNNFRGKREITINTFEIFEANRISSTISCQYIENLVKCIIF